jgi:hypothetical protein
VAWAVLVANHDVIVGWLRRDGFDGGQGARVARPPRDCRAAADVASLRVGGVRRQSRPSRFGGARR